jgi:hypothetical protein
MEGVGNSLAVGFGAGACICAKMATAKTKATTQTAKVIRFMKTFLLDFRSPMPYF